MGRGRSFGPACYCTDASGKGYGLMIANLPERAMREASLYKEKWRFVEVERPKNDRDSPLGAWDPSFETLAPAYEEWSSARAVEVPRGRGRPRAPYLEMVGRAQRAGGGDSPAPRRGCVAPGMENRCRWLLGVENSRFRCWRPE